ncbi:MAG TPA: hypothetical protein VGF08_07980 [Terriglobales bacterium]|jgi:hypothetical protein
MRTVRIVSAVAIFLNSLHLVHAAHHFLSNSPPEEVQSPFFWAGIALAAVVGVFSFIGGILLLKRSN